MRQELFDEIFDPSGPLFWGFWASVIFLAPIAVPFWIVYALAD